ncbi:hypothetical protein EJB05_28438 [Eragrostis curvula]|uniref:Uncharacterized protein n=1 Tax=Eragrostis curvula TaxID=38414 RepID=A0A5J9URZ9_9POAL|nr:hypothetical protein EJB05_28438 [Eragrostis curvula]
MSNDDYYFGRPACPPETKDKQETKANGEQNAVSTQTPGGTKDYFIGRPTSHEMAEEVEKGKEASATEQTEEVKKTTAAPPTTEKKRSGFLDKWLRCFTPNGGTE